MQQRMSALCQKRTFRHSITRQRGSTDGGMVRPSAVAVLRSITVSYLVGACTGRSAGSVQACRRMHRNTALHFPVCILADHKMPGRFSNKLISHAADFSTAARCTNLSFRKVTLSSVSACL